MKGRINRGVVHIITNEHGSVYELSKYNEDELVVTIQQISIWTEDGVMQKRTARAVIVDTIDAMIDANWTIGCTLPGNIITVQQTEPVDADNPEEYLLQVDGQYIRTTDNSYIWEYSYWDEHSQYEPHGDIDVLLTY